MTESATLKLKIQEVLTRPVNKIPIVDLVDYFVSYAYALRASDIHIHPEEDALRVRYRIDGILQDIFEKAGVHKSLHPEIISRIKVLAGLRTDEHLAPQDGRFHTEIPGVGSVNVRVSIMPTYHGENAILRVLAESQEYTVETLGFNAPDLAKLLHAIEKPYGMILANGPTGSGKTTTLYTILKRLNKPEVSIITIEDPIEFALEGTTQIQTDVDTNLTFGSGLRSILRQDPNIIMVGEIRDEETASIAVNAALTGHLVLSTLHTNDSATTFPRLLDMGVPPFLVASTVNLAIGQRLVRKLCPVCKVKRRMSNDELRSLHEIIPEIESDMQFYGPGSCDECTNGYKGRIAIREVVDVKDNIRQLVMRRADAEEIKNAAIADGMATMIQDGVMKATQGLTSIEELLRVVHE
jgi:type IV pilus assembly protein PilB